MANNNNTKNLNVPTLRFPEFKGEWAYKKLGDLCSEFKSGKNIKSAEILEDGIFPVFGGNGLRGFTHKYNYNGEYVIVGRQGALCGNIRLVEGKCYMTEHAIVIQGSEDNNTKFLLYLLDKLNLGQYSDQSAQPGLAVNKLQKIKVTIPNLSEQNKIASFLFLLDQRIKTQSKIIEDLKLLKNELLKKVFFQELRLPEFNENWKIVTLSDVGTFFSGGTPSTSIGQYYNGNIPFIKSGEINADNTEQFISEEGLRNSSAKMVEIGDLIYALYGATSGEVGISKIKGAINQAVLCIRTNLNSIFLLNFLMFKKEEILRTYLQGGQGNLSAEIIKSLKIPVPVHAEQTKLSHLFSAFDKKIELETNVMTKFKQQKQYLLANLFI